MKRYHSFFIRRLPLIFYDILIFALTALLLILLYPVSILPTSSAVIHLAAAALVIFGCRYFGKIYKQIWRYGGIQCYIRFLTVDLISFCMVLVLTFLNPVRHLPLTMVLVLCCVNTLLSLAMRMMYRYAFKCGGQDNGFGRFLRWLLKVFTGGTVETTPDMYSQKIKAAIVGAGTVGVNLAEQLMSNPRSIYVPRCFIDNNAAKIGRNIHGLAVLAEDEKTLNELNSHHIQEVIFAIPGIGTEELLRLYQYYRDAGFSVKTYDYPSLNIPGGKRRIREFSIEELLGRKTITVINDAAAEYYRGKTVLITGGGGSIGSELCRQVAKMCPKQLVIADIYENTAYDIQQELRINYQGKLDVHVEIVSITNKQGMARVFEEYHPQIVINAAAHKHVPLMEKNCIEAVENNVFGTLNVVHMCEKYHAERFMMVSTDKAVNPTSIMGATKRICEMITMNCASHGIVKCSATRFGNVLGSAGSVIPLFKRQIAAGGPVTVTDKRIIRYFMTIPEASQLVLESGAMAQNGELFVLDMGKPVRIWDLAAKMIQLSGDGDIEIIETGLRPGEKLYEELLVDKTRLEKTDNDLIFVEREAPLTDEELDDKLRVLDIACKSGKDEQARQAVMATVPTFQKKH